MKDANLLAWERLDLSRHIGKCLLLVDGKIVYRGKDADKALSRADAFKGKRAMFVNVPSPDRILVV